jgi:pilus assembly protein Flp/PilA
MVSLMTLQKFARDRSGAALVEYSLLIGLLTSAVVLVVVAMSAWVILRWGSLQAALGL